MKVRTKTYGEIKEIGDKNVGFVDSVMTPYCNKEIEVVIRNNEDFYQKEIDCYWYEGWLHLPEGFKAKIDDPYPLEGLLSIIHGDGGQYMEEHGIAKAYDDAIEKIGRWRNE